MVLFIYSMVSMFTQPVPQQQPTILLDYKYGLYLNNHVILAMFHIVQGMK